VGAKAARLWLYWTSVVSKKMNSSMLFLAPPGMNRSSGSSLRQRRGRHTAYRPLAAAIPGDSVAEGVVVNGLVNFFGLYQNVIIARILLSWFPALQRQPILQPIFTVCDPFLNIFRGML